MRYTDQFKEQFSLAYVHAVAAVAGCDVTRVNVDVNGYDITIAATDSELLPKEPKLDVQVKCSARELTHDAHLAFPLDVPTYRKLRKETLTPRILVVVTVPKEPADWVKQTEEEMALRHCGYWRSLFGEEDTSNETSITVHLPRTQLFTPEALQTIMEQIDRSGRL